MISDATISVIVGVTATAIITLIAFLFKRYFDNVVEGLKSLIDSSKEETRIQIAASQVERNIQHSDIKSDVIEIKADVKTIDAKVELQNGKVRDLQSWKEYHVKEGEYILKGFDKKMEELESDTDEKIKDLKDEIKKPARAKRR